MKGSFTENQGEGVSTVICCSDAPGLAAVSISYRWTAMRRPWREGLAFARNSVRAKHEPAHLGKRRRILGGLDGKGKTGNRQGDLMWTSGKYPKSQVHTV